MIFSILTSICGLVLFGISVQLVVFIERLENKITPKGNRGYVLATAVAGIGGLLFVLGLLQLISQWS